MKNSLLQLYNQYRNFILYCAIGVSGVAIDFGVFAAVVSYTAVGYVVANIMSTSLGITNNFLWNAHKNFQTTDKLKKRFATFYVVGMLGLLVSTALLYVFVDVWGWNELLSKALTIIFVVIVQYSLNKKFSFS